MEEWVPGLTAASRANSGLAVHLPVNSRYTLLAIAVFSHPQLDLKEKLIFINTLGTAKMFAVEHCQVQL